MVLVAAIQKDDLLEYGDDAEHPPSTNAVAFESVLDSHSKEGEHTASMSSPDSKDASRSNGLESQLARGTAR